MTGEPEIPLSGGRVTAGVVRVGDTVRRPPTANSPFVRRLLQHIRNAGFAGAAVPLGADGQGREVFTWIAGDVPADLALHDDATLVAAARLIRRYHDATIPLAGNAEVVCHNDLSPCNFVFRHGEPIAVIDFDAAAPGTRTRDLGYAAWLWLDIGTEDVSAAEQSRRLRLFLNAYGEVDVGAVLQAMLARQLDLAAEGASRDNTAMAGWASGCHTWTERYLKTLGG
jgi:aminoglycoside phosphotransferase (APT) family kinase protein